MGDLLHYYMEGVRFKYDGKGNAIPATRGLLKYLTEQTNHPCNVDGQRTIQKINLDTDIYGNPHFIFGLNPAIIKNITITINW